MKPHKPSPVPRKIDADISEILLPTENIRPAGLSDDAAGTFPSLTDSRLDSRGTRLSPSAWMNINFVAVSGLIALFSAFLIRDNFEYSRRQVHLPSDAADLKPELNSTGPNRFSLGPSRVATSVQLDRPSSKLADGVPYENHEPMFPAPAQHFRPDQTLGLLPNSNSLADRTIANNSSSVSSDNSGPARQSRTTTSSAENASGGAQSSSNHSTMRRSTRYSRRSTVSSRAAISNHRQNIRHPMVNSLRNSGVAKSGLQANRQNLNGMTMGNHHGQASAVKTQISGAQSLMSMHSLGTGNAVTRGAMNPMHMESGMLAQPGVGAGLGGITGNGLGGGGGAHVGNRVAK